jgi:uncharacterized protein
MDTKDLLGDESTPNLPPTSDEKTLAILSHILTILFWFIPPLVIYILKKDESAYVSDHSKESLNFQITLFILYMVSGVLVLLLIGFLLMFIIYIAQIALAIVATIRASEGKIYRYPVNFRFIK